MNPEASAELLSQLRDIQSAPTAPLWPPAPGWWILAAMLALLAFWLLRRAVGAWRLRRRRARLVSQLKQLRTDFDPVSMPQRYLSAINRLLKVAAIRAFPDQDYGALQGAEWVGFLAGGQDRVPNNASGLQPLAEGPYQALPEFDVDALEQAASAWLKRHG